MLTANERQRLLEEWNEDRREALARAMQRVAGMLSPVTLPTTGAEDLPAAESPQRLDPRPAAR
jgi:hypothetical protein